jgi:DNA recombination protein RmuC
LATHIRQLTEQSAEISKEALNLTRALKGDVRQQGAWGEMVLATLLERSGLREGEEYTLQEHHTTEEGHGRRPDAIVNLPENRRLVIDSKVSLKAYEQSIDAENETERALALKLHVQSMRTHIKGLAGKSYHQIDDAMLDYVIMFVPIEAALAAACNSDRDLTSFALESNVVVATPTTLMIALRTVANVWLVERRNRNALEIAARAGRLYDKVEGFVGDLQKVGEQLGRAQLSYDAALGKLSTGRGNVLGQIEKLKQLGAKASKSLPVELLDDEPDDSPPALPDDGGNDTPAAAES